MYVRMYVSMYVRRYVCTYVRKYVCTYVRMYICTYVRMYVVLYHSSQQQGAMYAMSYNSSNQTVNRLVSRGGEAVPSPPW